MLCQHPSAIAHILPGAFEPRASPNVADALYHLIDASDLEPRCSTRVRLAHSCRAMLIHEQLEVGAHFLVEILFDMPAP
jgi:hypothetical protein